MDSGTLIELMGTDSEYNKVNKEPYISPCIEFICIKVECGYNASSNDGGGVTAPEWGIIE